MKNYKLAREALANDCHLVGEYVGPPGSAHTCPIGRLAIMSGVTRSELRSVNTDSIVIDCDMIRYIRRIIRKKFGLSPMDLARIQEANDCYLDKLDSSIINRRQEVVKMLDEIHQQHENKQ